MNNIRDGKKYDCDILYVAFIELADIARSGSSVRPQKMLKAFLSLGLNMKVLDGWNNQIGLRRKRVRDTLKWLRNNTPSICYIEPPTGPFFCYEDIVLIKRLKKMNVPVGLFYRDAYWKFPEFDMNEQKKSAVQKLKLFIIKIMQMRDLRVFTANCKHIFFPSDTMAQYFVCKEKSALPPGCEVLQNCANDAQIERIKNADALTMIYVGGIDVQCGISMLVESLKRINRDRIRIKFILVCPKSQWDSINTMDTEGCDEWITVKHVGNGEELERLYNASDLAVIPKIRTVYNDFAMCAKLFEYLSYLKPVVVTDCTEMASFVSANGIGWVTQDNEESLFECIEKLCEERDSILTVRENCQRAVIQNSWQQRAARVCNVLSDGKMSLVTADNGSNYRDAKI